MKTKNIILFAAGATFSLFLGSNKVYATENLEVNILEESKMMRMELSIPASSEMNVMLYNNSSRVLFSDKIDAGTTFEDQFDFSQVREGTYTLVSELGNLRYSRLLEVTSEDVRLINSFYSFIPQFYVEEDKLMVHFNNPSMMDIGVSIQSNEDVVFDAFYTKPGETFANTFLLNGLDRGSYVVRLVSGGEFYTYAFDVK